MYLPHLSREVFQPNWSSTSEAGFGPGLVVLDHERVVALDHVAHEAGVRMGMRKGGVLTSKAGKRGNCRISERMESR